MGVQFYINIGITAILLMLVLILILKSRKEQNLYDKVSNIIFDVGSLPDRIADKLTAVTARENQQIYSALAANSERQIKVVDELKLALSTDLSVFKEEFKKDTLENFVGLSDRIESRLDKINSKVEERLQEGFKKTNETFTSVIERLSRIDAAQKKIDTLSTEIVSLQNVLTDKKSRGIFGEVQLKQLLLSIFGEKNGAYSIQHSLSNGSIADAILMCPEPVGKIAIDSKFPLENYVKMVDSELDMPHRNEARKNFKTNMKKHIDDISMKYIIPDETAEQAVLFLPAEAIFAEINAYHPELVEYAHKKRVWLCSPTTLMAVLTTLQVILQNIEREKYATIIHDELNKLGDEFGRFQKRWNSLSNDIDKVSKDVKDLNITGSKIERRFNQLSNAELGQDFEKLDNDE